MNPAASTQASRSQQKPSDGDTHMHGRQLVLARAVWVILVMLTLGVFDLCFTPAHDVYGCGLR